MIAMMGNDLNDGCLGFWAGLRCWLFGVPLSFVLPGNPHPGPLPPSGRGESAFGA